MKTKDLDFRLGKNPDCFVDVSSGDDSAVCYKQCSSESEFGGKRAESFERTLAENQTSAALKIKGLHKNIALQAEGGHPQREG